MLFCQSTGKPAVGSVYGVPGTFYSKFDQFCEKLWDAVYHNPTLVELFVMHALLLRGNQVRNTPRPSAQSVCPSFY